MKPIEVKDNTFIKEVIESNMPVMVDFWAPWCVPCRMVGPIIEELAGEFEGKAKICKVNTDENQGISRTLNIRSIPTVAIFFQGKVQDVIIGARPKRNYIKALNSAIKKAEKLAKKAKK
jgi:thioredoxin 1